MIVGDRVPRVSFAETNFISSVITFAVTSFDLSS